MPTTQERWLDFYRATLAVKCSGLTEEQVRTASVPPSPLTLLGPVQHMAEVERNWFRRVLTGDDAPPAGHNMNVATTVTIGDGDELRLMPGSRHCSVKRWRSGSPTRQASSPFSGNRGRQVGADVKGGGVGGQNWLRLR
jgi:Protein of unknown function (DUF664)